MTIETKYNPGDTVWFMSNNKIVQSSIKKLSMSFIYSLEVSWELELEEEGSFIHNMPASRTEDKLFSTKQELIDSL